MIFIFYYLLIPLQVNNWNEERKNQRSEQKLLQALLREFAANSEVLEKTIALNAASVSAGLAVGNYTGPSLA